MKVTIIIPTYNEQKFLATTLDSLLKQSVPAQNIIIVDDNSTDATKDIARQYESNHKSISYIKHNSKNTHEPGSKVVSAFLYGLKQINSDFDILCKFDADLIFPSNYIEKIIHHFSSNQKIGLVGGHCYILKKNNWVLENLTNKDHIRGALKAYRKECFNAIGGLKNTMGWDTVDELLAQYHGWSIKADSSLKVKHLKPTGKAYSKTSKYNQGEAFYKMRYGLILTQIASIKLALKKKSFTYYKNCSVGYFNANKNNTPFIVSPKEGAFIRKLRWQKILKKLNPFV